MKLISNFAFLFFIISNLISCSTAQQASEVQSIRIPVAPVKNAPAVKAPVINALLMAKFNNVIFREYITFK